MVEFTSGNIVDFRGRRIWKGRGQTNNRLGLREYKSTKSPVCMSAFLDEKIAVSCEKL
jgi:hypothetical protein